VDVFLKDETLWLTQKALAELFGVQRPAVTKHLKNIFETGELEGKVVCSILELTTPHGALEGKTQTQKTQLYNLDAIIAVGYRVNSFQATQFRIWATRTLREFIIKGFVMDDERLKQGKQVFGKAKGTISKHIKHIFEDEGFAESSVVWLYRTTAADGKTYKVAHYNLDMVLAKYGEGFCKPFLTTPAHNPRSFAKGFQNPSPYCHCPPREKS